MSDVIFQYFGSYSVGMSTFGSDFQIMCLII